MTEMTTLKEIMLAAAGKSTLFRQNTGQGWVGKSRHYSTTETVTVRPGDVVIRQARPLHAGLIKGSSDLIGWTKFVVEPRHVGRQVAAFTAVEVKPRTGGLITAEQEHFISVVDGDGGIAGIARSTDDYLRLARKFTPEGVTQ